MNKKVILIQGLLAPYRYPIFEGLSKRPDWDFEVWFMGRAVKNRVWDEFSLDEYTFKYKFLDGITLNFGIKDNYPFWINLSIFKTLLKSKPDVVIMMGWDSVTSFLAHIYCYLTKTKFVLYSDSTIEERSWRRSITMPFVKLHVRSSSALVSGGTKNSEYLQSLGADVKNIYISYNTIDVDKYNLSTNEYRKHNDITKKDLGLGTKKVIMYYGQFIERKGVDILLLAYKKLKEKNDDICLLMLGDGPFKDNIFKLIARYDIKDVFIFKNPGDHMICKYYAVADIFVLPSREDVWGLVINEAMCAGLPVIASKVTGSSRDLIVNAVNGYVFETGNVDDLSSKIKIIIENPDLKKEMSRASLEIIRKYNPRLTLTKFMEAIDV